MDDTMRKPITLTFEDANLNLLRLAQCCRARQDVRYYLKSVLLEVSQEAPGQEAQVQLVATDGHRLAAATITDQDLGGFHDAESLLLDLDQGRQIPASVSRVILTVTPGAAFDTPGFAHYYKRNGQLLKSVTVAQIDGKFPEWRRVVGEKHGAGTPTGVSFNAVYLAEMAKAVGSEGGQVTLSWQACDTGQVVRSVMAVGFSGDHLAGAEYQCVLMPCRMDR